MDDARNAPIVSPDQAEEFFATGYNARTSESNRACTVDVPAVGATPASQLPSLLGASDPSQLQMRAADAARNLLFFERADRHLSLLAFAARDLAESRIMRALDRSGDPLVTPSWCMECQHNEINGSIVHAANCNTGRVFDVIEELQRISLRSGKEAGANEPELEQPCAEGASSPRGDYGEPWNGKHSEIFRQDGSMVCSVWLAGQTFDEVFNAPRVARRIAACVNYCEGETTEFLEGCTRDLEDAGGSLSSENGGAR